jgi:hypothetical protein
MILLDEPSHSTKLAEDVLAAVERADLNDRNLGLADLCDEVPGLAEELEAARLKTILVAAGCRCATELISTWVRVCPDDSAPLVALEATRAWLVEPTRESATRSATLSQAALHSFARARGPDRQKSWPAHAWFARTCAWLADAPQYGWQSVAALLGLIKAGVRTQLVVELAAQLRQARQGEG